MAGWGRRRHPRVPRLSSTTSSSNSGCRSRCRWNWTTPRCDRSASSSAGSRRCTPDLRRLEAEARAVRPGRAGRAVPRAAGGGCSPSRRWSSGTAFAKRIGERWDAWAQADRRGQMTARSAELRKERAATARRADRAAGEGAAGTGGRDPQARPSWTPNSTWASSSGPCGRTRPSRGRREGSGARRRSRPGRSATCSTRSTWSSWRRGTSGWRRPHAVAGLPPLPVDGTDVLDRRSTRRTPPAFRPR